MSEPLSYDGLPLRIYSPEELKAIGFYSWEEFLEEDDDEA